MERLTQRVLNYHAVTLDACKHGCAKGNKMDCPRCKPLTNALFKLAEYEDAEEQGLLLRLPCKVGDTIYVIPSKVNYKMNELLGGGINGVCAQTVDRIEYGKYGFWVSTCDGHQGHREENFGVTWFLTEEEAEQALAEMKGE